MHSTRIRASYDFIANSHTHYNLCVVLVYTKKEKLFMYIPTYRHSKCELGSIMNKVISQYEIVNSYEPDNAELAYMN